MEKSHFGWPSSWEAPHPAPFEKNVLFTNATLMVY